MTLTKDQILAADDRKLVSVEVPEWGGTVNVAPMTSTERLRYMREASAEGADWRSIAVACCTVDDDGKLLFTAADVAALGQKNGVAVERVFKAAAQLNRLTPDTAEEERKNS